MTTTAEDSMHDGLAAGVTVRPGRWELVAMIASLLALNALAIDIMLPALRLIASELQVSDPNDQQLVVISYVLGFGVPQVVYGPLSDRFGRRRVVFACLTGYMVTGLACALAPSFGALLLMRFCQGVCAAGCRVVGVAIVRDLFEGRRMARTMSLVMTVFMVVPIVAPAIGQSILAFVHWRWCFGFLVFAGGLLLTWTALRLPETLPAERRTALSLRSAASAYMEVFRHRQTVGYMFSAGVLFGALFAFISSAEQIFREVFHQGERFALWFAVVALSLSAANFLNARWVERIGMRRLSHLALVGFSVISTLLLVALQAGGGFGVFLPLFALCFGLFGLIGVNFNALAMQPLGRIAGTASAAYGLMTTTLSGLLGAAIGRTYDGTAMPMMAGFLALGVAAFGLVLWTERGRVFRSASAAPAE